MRVHLEANTECVALVAAFLQKTGALYEGWAPMLVELEEWEEHTVPNRGAVVWGFKTKPQPFEVRVAFLAKSSPALGELRTLLKNMTGPDDKLRTAQTRKLRDLMAPWLSSDAVTRARPSSWPSADSNAAGPFEWRPQAQRAPFTPTKPGVLLYSHGAP